MPTEPTADRRHLVFVYGSLMRGLHNHGHLEGPGAEFVGRGHTGPGLGLLDLGSFPGLVHHRDCPGVRGELYRVDDATLARLDRLEGVDPHHPERGLYRRDTYAVVADRSGPAAAALYLFNPRGRAEGYRLVPPGTGMLGLVDWRGHLAARPGGRPDCGEPPAACECDPGLDEDAGRCDACGACGAARDPESPTLCDACRDAGDEPGAGIPERATPAWMDDEDEDEDEDDGSHPGVADGVAWMGLGEDYPD